MSQNINYTFEIVDTAITNATPLLMMGSQRLTSNIPASLRFMLFRSEYHYDKLCREVCVSYLPTLELAQTLKQDLEVLYRRVGTLRITD